MSYRIFRTPNLRISGPPSDYERIILYNRSDPVDNYIKLTGLLSALIWYQVALLGTRKIARTTERHTTHIYSYLKFNMGTNLLVQGLGSTTHCVIYWVQSCGAFCVKQILHGTRAENAHSVKYF